MRILGSLFIALAIPLFASGSVPTPPKSKAVKPAPKTQLPASIDDSFKAEFFTNLDDAQEKILHLAESVPADRYTWRPDPDVRSISEVFMHIAGSNYFLATFLGAEAPKMDGDMEKVVTRKADVIADLKRSFEYLRHAVTTTRDLQKPVKMFGAQTTRRGVLVTILSHLHEHLGQSIAYARMNGVVPPWSR